MTRYVIIVIDIDVLCVLSVLRRQNRFSGCGNWQRIFIRAEKKKTTTTTTKISKKIEKIENIGGRDKIRTCGYPMDGGRVSLCFVRSMGSASPANNFLRLTCCAHRWSMPSRLMQGASSANVCLHPVGFVEVMPHATTSQAGRINSLTGSRSKHRNMSRISYRANQPRTFTSDSIQALVT